MRTNLFLGNKNMSEANTNQIAIKNILESSKELMRKNIGDTERKMHFNIIVESAKELDDGIQED